MTNIEHLRMRLVTAHNDICAAGQKLGAAIGYDDNEEAIKDRILGAVSALHTATEKLTMARALSIERRNRESQQAREVTRAEGSGVREVGETHRTG